MAKVKGVVDFSRMYCIDRLTKNSFGGSGNKNTMNLTGVTSVGGGFDRSAKMDDKNGNGQLNAIDTLKTTFPGDSTPTTLQRVDTNGIASAGNGFGSGKDFAVWEDPSGNMYILFSQNFNLNRISNNCTLTLKEHKDAVGTMAVSDIICFADGTPVKTPLGCRTVEDLQTGDLVCVVGKDPQPILWISKTHVNETVLTANPKLRPITISEGALGNGLPLRNLRLSRQHRLVLRSAIVRRMFGQDEILVAAHQLTDIPGVYADNSCAPVTYYHILLADHEMLESAGIPCESLHPGPQTLQTLSPDQQEELDFLVPDLPQRSLHNIGAVHASRGQIRNLISRSLANQKPLFDAGSAFCA